MKVSVLIENTTSRDDLAAEHGLSLLIETAGKTILFDTGQTGAFADNAEKMGFDLKTVDLAILSHGHYDHGGGLKRFLELNDHAPVYLNKNAFEPHYPGTEKSIGVDPDLANNKRLVTVGDEYVLGEGLSLHTCNGWKTTVPIDSFGLQMLDHGKLVPDDFRHEQYLLVKDGDRTILFSGCSHKGILNIVDWFRPDVLVGGFHFKKLDPADPVGRKRLTKAAELLLPYPTRYYTGHCTGVEQYEFLKGIMGDRLSYLSTGQAVTL